MNLRLIPTTIEIYFWSLLIGLLSDSELAQRFVRKVHAWVISGQFKRALRLTLVVCAAGFVLGFILGLFGV
jgi:hypothetical protein